MITAERTSFSSLNRGRNSLFGIASPNSGTHPSYRSVEIPANTPPTAGRLSAVPRSGPHRSRFDASTSPIHPNASRAYCVEQSHDAVPRNRHATVLTPPRDRDPDDPVGEVHQRPAPAVDGVVTGRNTSRTSRRPAIRYGKHSLRRTREHRSDKKGRESQCQDPRDTNEVIRKSKGGNSPWGMPTGR